MKGKHLIIDAEYKTEITKSQLKKFLDELPETLDMHNVIEPVIFEDDEHNPGLSGISIIDYSHVAVHTFTKTKRLNIDIFSCKEFKRKPVIELAKYYFNPIDLQIICLERKV